MAIWSKLGATDYTLEERENQSEVVAIARTNDEGTTRFYVPRDLFEKYAERRAEEIVRKLVQQAFK